MNSVGYGQYPPCRYTTRGLSDCVSKTKVQWQVAGVDIARRERAEAEVGLRRFTGKLPFPEEERELLEDILDYPPKGTFGCVPRARWL
jgi:hypothetical protein